MRLEAAEKPDRPWLAADRHEEVEIRFIGRLETADRAALLAKAGGGGLDLAWSRQIHSDKVLDADTGLCGTGDALVTGRRGLALSVVTADCVPVVLTDGERLAVVHAGWRGIAASIVTAALERLEATAPVVAWLGPAIGPCCYEVGDEVARDVIAASAATVRVDRGDARPHLDLQAAVAAQLGAAGVDTIHRVGECTRCHPDNLASYRRDGARAGRNTTFAWRCARAGRQLDRC